MSATKILVGQVIDAAILVILGDKIAAEKQREIRRTIESVHAGEITAEKAYEKLRFEDGDELDKLLPLRVDTEDHRE